MKRRISIAATTVDCYSTPAKFGGKQGIRSGLQDFFDGSHG
jgi:hypothetical protein